MLEQTCMKILLQAIDEMGHLQNFSGTIQESGYRG